MKVFIGVFSVLSMLWIAFTAGGLIALRDHCKCDAPKVEPYNDLGKHP